MYNNVCDAAMLLGSSRQTGFSRRLGRALPELAPGGLRLREVSIADLPLYHEDLETDSPPRAWVRFRDEIRAAGALLFVTPEYNRSVPAMLKNAIDVGSSPDGSSVWARKPAAIASFSPGRLGGFGANHHLRQSLVFLDVPVLQQPEVYLAGIGDAFDSGGALRAGPVRELLCELLRAFHAWAVRCREVPS